MRILALLLIVSASTALAAPCPVSTTITNCPATSACSTWEAPATGIAVSYEVALNGTAFPLIPATTFRFDMPVPAGKSIGPADTWSYTAIAEGGLRGTPFTCSQPYVVNGPAIQPSVPRNVRHAGK